MHTRNVYDILKTGHIVIFKRAQIADFVIRFGKKECWVTHPIHLVTGLTSGWLNIQNNTLLTDARIVCVDCCVPEYRQTVVGIVAMEHKVIARWRIFLRGNALLFQ